MSDQGQPGTDPTNTKRTRLVLTEAELAEALNSSKRTVATMRARGMPYVALPTTGRRRHTVRYDWESVRAWLIEQARREAESAAIYGPRRGRPRKPHV